jgi:cytoskeletal protein CcmA (bactofilin family)
MLKNGIDTQPAAGIVFTEFQKTEVGMAPKSNGDQANNVIGENSYFSGNFHINGSLRIDGRFEGRYLQAEQIYIGKGGKVKTSINAVSIIIEGLVLGDITATSRVLLMPTARILGDIRTPELIIQNGVILEGRCTISNDLRSSAREMLEAEYQKNRLIPEEFLEESRSRA